MVAFVTDLVLGLDNLSALLTKWTSDPKTYSPTEMKHCLDGFRDVLFKHLDEEVIVFMSSFWLFFIRFLRSQIFVARICKIISLLKRLKKFLYNWRGISFLDIYLTCYCYTGGLPEIDSYHIFPCTVGQPCYQLQLS